MANEKLQFDDMLANPEFRAVLESEVRAIVRERLRLRTTVNNVVMAGLTVIALAGFGLAANYTSQLRDAQKWVTEAKTKIDAVIENRQKITENVIQIRNTFTNAAKASETKQAPKKQGRR
jgi:nitrogen regulatory protein PII